MNEQKHERHHAAREAFQESLERLQQVLDLAEAQVSEPKLNDRFPAKAPDVEPSPTSEAVDLEVWEDAVNDIDRFLQSHQVDS